MTHDFVGFYTKHVEDLKKEGKQYLGYCPFHSDKGSKQKGFSVNPDNGVWFCFSGCGGGNAISFCKELNIPVDQAPDYDEDYNKYYYNTGVGRAKGKKITGAGERKEMWLGTGGKGLPEGTKPYNHQAIDQARELKQRLWICEGEKDTLTMLEAGELAMGLPSATMVKVLDAVPFESVKGTEIIVACDNDDAGKKAAENILMLFPWAKKIVWPEGKGDGYDVTDLKEEIGTGFVDILKGYAVVEDPFYPLTEILSEKHERDQNRDPDKLLGYELQKFHRLAKHIDGVQPGFYVVGAETNVGKTALLCNLTLDLIDSNEQLTGIYFSLDDNKNTILNRFLSIKTGIPLNQVQRPQKTDRHRDMLQEGYSYLFGLADNKRLFIRDAAEISHNFVLEAEIKRRMDRELFIVIDGLYNLDVGLEGGDTRRENIERANVLKRLSDVYRIPVICTGELRKKEGGAKAGRTPTIDDLMETGKFAYNANLVLLVYPDDWDSYNTDDDPSLNMKYAKNKLSHFRNTTKIKFIRETSQIEETSL
jgi:replicative DNA helicase